MQDFKVTAGVPSALSRGKAATASEPSGCGHVCLSFASGVGSWCGLLVIVWLGPEFVLPGSSISQWDPLESPVTHAQTSFQSKPCNSLLISVFRHNSVHDWNLSRERS